MAPLIAVQVHKVLKAREEERCVKLERSTGKKIKRRKIPRPVVRMGPDALCQNTDILKLVTEYDYDVSDLRFQDYCSSRGVTPGGVHGSTRWKFFADHSLSKQDYLANPYFHFAQEFQGTRHTYTPEEMESQWNVIFLGRAALQDCWELLFKRNQAKPRKRTSKASPRRPARRKR